MCVQAHSQGCSMYRSTSLSNKTEACNFSKGSTILCEKTKIGHYIDTIPNIGIGNANVNGNNPRFAYP